MSVAEEWRDIKGYEGFYQVSNLGRLRSLDRVVLHAKYGSARVKGRVLALRVNRHGYDNHTLCNATGGREHRDTARLVLETFGALKPGHTHQCDHINRVRLDNRAANLRWVTPRENQFNLSKAKNNRSGEIGVSWHKRGQKWQVHLSGIKGRKFLGLFTTKIAAATARHQAELKYHQIN